ncbi:S41 family peptidase [Mycoplasma sp. HS2188]|uniref:S41 family peptidase n=1 Tax=Mycoplasma sp. HS2188 TaxID=2976765 RepID=UPI0021AA41C0|nr:S41 family peptidase [Mycoplasma sp. HS2188]MCT4469706.1 S41 family peptidase [Mycoplasma sp. HS2188]
MRNKKILKLISLPISASFFPIALFTASCTKQKTKQDSNENTEKNAIEKQEGRDKQKDNTNQNSTNNTVVENNNEGKTNINNEEKNDSTTNIIAKDHLVAPTPAELDLISNNVQLIDPIEQNNDFIVEDDEVENTSEPSYVSLFKHKTNQQIYVNINEFFTNVPGYFSVTALKEIKSNKPSIISYKVNDSDDLIFDAEQEKITYTSENSFIINDQSETPDPQYNSHLNESENVYQYNRVEESDSLDINLKKYNFDIIVKDNFVYIPLAIFNLFFMSNGYNNIQYNNDKLLILSYELSRTTDTDSLDREIETLYSGNKNVTGAQRRENYDFLALLFDNFYGLNNELYKRNGNAIDFYSFAKTTNLENELLSTTPSKYYSAYKKLWGVYLNEAHSRIISKSYAQTNEKYVPNNVDTSAKSKEYDKLANKLYELKYGVDSENETEIDPNKLFQVENDTARITIDSFNLEIEPSRVNANDLWKYDTFFFMLKAMEQIKDYNNKNNNVIKNIVLDISQNGGGSPLSAQQLLGFLTNSEKKIKQVIMDKMSKILYDIEYLVDTNNDGTFDQNDGYANLYNWYVLTSGITFSAANMFAHVVKTNNLATLIGQKTAGGMYSILPTVLPDGTNVDISSVNAYAGKSNEAFETLDEFPNTEDGVEPDITLSYEHFYNGNILKHIKQNDRQ